MKWSKYNILFKVQTEDIYLFFNTMSNSVLKLDSDNAKILMDYGGCVKIDTSSFLLSLYLVYHIIRYLLQLCC